MADMGAVRDTCTWQSSTADSRSGALLWRLTSLQVGKAYGGFPLNRWTRRWPSLPGLSPARRCPMTTAPPIHCLATIQPAFTDPERLALAGFLPGNRGLTTEAYTLDLRQFTTWCRTRSLPLFAVRRADIEGFAAIWKPEGAPVPPSPGGWSTIAGFCKYAVEEELLDHSPAAHAGGRGWIMSLMPPPWTATNLEPCWWPRARAAARSCADLPARAERAPGIGGHRRWHRAPGPGAQAPDPDDYPQGRQRRHHTLAPAPPGRSTWPPGNAATAPSSSPTTGGGWTSTAPGGSSAKSRAAPESARTSARTRSGTRSSPPVSTSACRCAMFKKRLPTLTREPPWGTTGPAAAWTGTLPISSPPTSPVPPGNPYRLATPSGPSRQTDIPVGARWRWPRGSHWPRPQHAREPPFGIVRGRDRLITDIVHNGRCVPLRHTMRRDADPAVRGDRCDHCVDADAHPPRCPGSMFHRELRVRQPAPPDLVLM